jgi:predicted small lipoprotein YifL
MGNRISSYLLWLTLIIAGAGVCLGGCGHKGRLYLPEEPEQQNSDD